jgi:hypothetical protein
MSARPYQPGRSKVLGTAAVTIAPRQNRVPRLAAAARGGLRRGGAAPPSPPVPLTPELVASATGAGVEDLTDIARHVKDATLNSRNDGSKCI